MIKFSIALNRKFTFLYIYIYIYNFKYYDLFFQKIFIENSNAEIKRRIANPPKLLR